MAFGVTKWPKPFDPREPMFGMQGFEWGACLPWKWFVHAPNATGLFTYFHTPRVVLIQTNAFADKSWSGASVTDPYPSVYLNIVGFNDNQPSPVDHSVYMRMVFAFFGSAPNIAESELYLERPYPLQVFTFNSFTGGLAIDISPPVTITPAIHTEPYNPS